MKDREIFLRECLLFGGFQCDGRLEDLLRDQGRHQSGQEHDCDQLGVLGAIDQVVGQTKKCRNGEV